MNFIFKFEEFDKFDFNFKIEKLEQTLVPLIFQFGNKYFILIFF